ncbi:transposase, MuDR, MULE transposase domain protein, partial [Tanacetum coccineum]
NVTVEDVGEDADFNSGAWVSATNCVNAFDGTVTGCLGDIDNFLKKRKLEQVVAIVKSCSPNALGDLNVTLKDLSGTVPGTIHYKVLDVGSYENDITVGAAMILANILVFTPKPSKHYLNITKRNVVEVFPEKLKKPPLPRRKVDVAVARTDTGTDTTTENSTSKKVLPIAAELSKKVVVAAELPESAAAYTDLLVWP